VEQWYNSQECGNAVADMLFGDVNPSGKLPTTFPKRLEDNPAFVNYPGENGKVFYGEGLFVGYRYYEKKDIEPLFPFGHGLSYTRFAYGRLQLNRQQFTAEEGLEVLCDVSNMGQVAGKEVVQLYVRDVQSTLVRPEKELKAFAKVALEPGETKTVAFKLNREAFWFYDPAGEGWQTEPGEFEILVGASSQDIRLRKTVSLVSGHEGGAGLNSGMRLRALLADENGRAVLRRHFGDLLSTGEGHMALDYTLDYLAQLAPEMLPAEKLAEINEELSEVVG
jgi:beta-glucosidase